MNYKNIGKKPFLECALPTKDARRTQVRVYEISERGNQFCGFERHFRRILSVCQCRAGPRIIAVIPKTQRGSARF